MSIHEEVIIPSDKSNNEFDFDAFFQSNYSRFTNVVKREYLWNELNNIIIKKIISCKYDNKYYIHFVCKYYGRKKIDTMKLILFADHGMNTMLKYSTVPNPELLKEKDSHSYCSIYRTGVEYSLCFCIDDMEKDIVYNWVNVDLNEESPLEFSSLQYSIQSKNDQKSFIPVSTFTEIDESTVSQLEMPKPKVKRKNKSTDQVGTSRQEQSIYYHIKTYFDDAINRARIKNQEGTIIEVDVYIPSIKVAIEYDGKYWHTRKQKQDNEKNVKLNNMGIYVIRVRDIGLPELAPFNGYSIQYGKPPKGNHIDVVITTIMRSLAIFVSDERKDKLCRYTLTYSEYLDTITNIGALLFKNEKEHSFLYHSAYKYWDYKKNGDLKPQNIEPSSNTFAWFKCPRGDNLLRIVSQVKDTTNQKEAGKDCSIYSVFSICPFLPHDGLLSTGSDCGDSCCYVEPLFIDMINQFIDNGAYQDQIDEETLKEIEHYPRVAFIIMQRMISADDDTKKRLEHLFLSEKNIYNGRVDFISNSVRIDTPDEIEEILAFRKMYPNTYIITPAIKHCHCGHWYHQVLDKARESGDQSMTGRASGFVTVMS